MQQVAACSCGPPAALTVKTESTSILTLLNGHPVRTVCFPSPFSSDIIYGRSLPDEDEEHLAPDAGEELGDAGVPRRRGEVVSPGQELEDADEARLEGRVVDQLRPIVNSNN